MRNLQASLIGNILKKLLLNFIDIIAFVSIRHGSNLKRKCLKLIEKSTLIVPCNSRDTNSHQWFSIKIQNRHIDFPDNIAISESIGLRIVLIIYQFKSTRIKSVRKVIVGVYIRKGSILSRNNTEIGTTEEGSIRQMMCIDETIPEISIVISVRCSSPLRRQRKFE